MSKWTVEANADTIAAIELHYPVLFWPERTCCKVLMVWFFPATEFTPNREVEYFGCSWCGEYLSDTDCYGLDDGPNYCPNCGRMVDKSFVIDQNTGEVIYRDGAEVVE